VRFLRIRGRQVGNEFRLARRQQAGESRHTAVAATSAAAATATAATTATASGS